MKITVHASKTYDVTVDKGVLSTVGDVLKSLGISGKVCIVSDDNVAPIYAEEVADNLIYAGYDVSDFVIEAGEDSKTLQNYTLLLSHLGAQGFTRTDTVLALGGGVVGDLAGYAAATYMRGVHFVQVPTSLLAAIDSSVGGKTAVNLPQGKNLAGAFYQPDAVIFDVNTLKTLPAEEIRCGMGEAVKYAVLEGGSIYETLKNGITMDNIVPFVASCVECKKKIVEADERESNMRKYLNLGHTVGHAVELYTDYAVPHGIAVAMGVAEMARLATLRGELPQTACDDIIALIKGCGLSADGYPIEELLPLFAADKKRAEGKITLVTVRGIGDCTLTDLPFDKVGEYFEGK